tara:strand:+ start:1480 stop:1653 length:174 start_codon:yes stop_codon:yes gene_type:complete
MSLDDRRDHLIAKAISMINDDIALPVDLLAELDELGVSLNWLFLEAASTTPSIYNIE